MRFFKRPYSGKRTGTEAEAGEAPAGEKKRSVFGIIRAWWREVHKALKITIMIIIGLLAASLGLLIIFLVGKSMLYQQPGDNNIQINQPSPSGTVPSVSPLPTPSGTVPSVRPSPDHGYVKREGVYTFLLAGSNQGLTDTLMVATLDTKAGTCHMLSIPRDTAVASAPRSLKKINGAYSQRSGIDEEDQGITNLKKEIATLIGYQPEYAAVVDYNGFKRLIQAIDGIDFNVPMRMYLPSEGINLQKGEQHLNADEALQVVRFRVGVNGAGYDDYGRMETQQKLLGAVINKALANWTKFPEYIDIARENVKSDIDWSNILWFADQVRKIGMDNVQFSTLPTVSVVNPAELDYMYYEMVLSEEALTVINDTINPFGIPIREELVEHMKLTEK
ncbi:MAG: LCP family protein [Oscillospiraceae bacterium]|jgi:LCP family protein required for cell wall assembly|nr:LCP family protein [Oscillospiraceae bacterium]